MESNMTIQSTTNGGFVANNESGIVLNIAVAKIGEAVQLTVPTADINAWLHIGVARVLQDAHAGIKAEDYADRAELRGAVVAAMFKRFEAGPAGSRAPGERDEVGAELAKILRAKLRAMKIESKDAKGTDALAKLFFDGVRAAHPGVADDRLTQAMEALRAKAANIVATRKAAAEAGPSLESLLG